MKRSTFKLLFYVNKQKEKANGNCPIMGRITVDGKISQYSTGEEVSIKRWNASIGRVKVSGVKGEEAKELKAINTRLDELENIAKNAYIKLYNSSGFASAQMIKNVLTGQAQAKDTLLTLIDEHNEVYATRVGIDRVRHSYVRYLTCRSHFSNFLQYKYQIEDITLRSLDRQFLNDFIFYLSTVLKLKTASLNDYLIILRKMARLAVKQRTIKRDPFSGYQMEIPEKQHRRLTSEQLEKVMNVVLHTYRLAHTRDLFVFAAFTGLGRVDLANLTTNHLTLQSDGSYVIVIDRQKTKEECRIKLGEIATAIMNKYKGEGKDNKLFFVPGTSSLCRNLKDIQKICGLDCHLTFYMARHTFATQAVTNGVPIECISKMMGHTNIKTTQIYAEITNQMVARDFKKISDKNKGKHSLPEDNMPSRVFKCGRYRGWKDEVQQNASPE